jgi:hypothetical protein
MDMDDFERMAAEDDTLHMNFQIATHTEGIELEDVIEALGILIASLIRNREKFDRGLIEDEVVNMEIGDENVLIMGGLGWATAFMKRAKAAMENSEAGEDSTEEPGKKPKSKKDKGKEEHVEKDEIQAEIDKIMSQLNRKKGG